LQSLPLPPPTLQPTHPPPLQFPPTYVVLLTHGSDPLGPPHLSNPGRTIPRAQPSLSENRVPRQKNSVQRCGNKIPFTMPSTSSTRLVTHHVASSATAAPTRRTCLHACGAALSLAGATSHDDALLTHSLRLHTVHGAHAVHHASTLCRRPFAAAPPLFSRPSHASPPFSPMPPRLCHRARATVPFDAHI
jgi:hypothetical protein